MPIKFKCGNCSTVISVKSELAGKSGKCPKCKNPIRVPTPKKPGGSGQPKAAGQKPPGQKTAGQKAAKPAQAPAPQPAAPGALDSLFDDAGLVEKKGPTCKACGADIKPGTVVCTSCGTNFQTGEQIQGAALAGSTGPEFDNQYLQLASDNMVRDLDMESRRDKAAMPWWVLMSFLIGAITLCAAGVVIVDGQFGTLADEGTFMGKVQRMPVFCTLGLTSLITGTAITVFAHMSICIFAFGKKAGHGVACFFLPLIFSIIYGAMHWAENKAPIKAIMTAVIFIGLGVFLIIQGGGFGKIQAVFN